MAIDDELIQVWKEFAKKTNGQFDFDETTFAGGDQFKCHIKYSIALFTL